MTPAASAVAMYLLRAYSERKWPCTLIIMSRRSSPYAGLGEVAC